MATSENTQKHTQDAQQALEAYTAAASVLAKGFQTIASESADFSRRSLEQGAAAVEKAIAAKSFDRVLEIQQGYARESYEAALSQMNKIGEIYMSTTKEAYKPFENHFGQFLGRFSGK